VTAVLAASAYMLRILGSSTKYTGTMRHKRNTTTSNRVARLAEWVGWGVRAVLLDWVRVQARTARGVVIWGGSPTWHAGRHNRCNRSPAGKGCRSFLLWASAVHHRRNSRHWNNPLDWCNRLGRLCTGNPDDFVCIPSTHRAARAAATVLVVDLAVDDPEKEEGRVAQGPRAVQAGWGCSDSHSRGSRCPRRSCCTAHLPRHRRKGCHSPFVSTRSCRAAFRSWGRSASYNQAPAMGLDPGSD
jgi:hypothetical protein